MSLILLALVAWPAETYPKISQPVEINEQDVAIPISKAIRSATLDEIDAASIPIEPVRYRFTCSVIPRSGILQHCMPADSVRPDMTTLDFAKESNAYLQSLRELPKSDPSLVALSRVSWVRMKGDSNGERVATPYKFVTITETVSAADRLTLPLSDPPLKMSDVSFEGDLGRMFSALYPPQALRMMISARVKARCKVDETRHLVCRDGEIVGLPEGSYARDIAVRDFTLATYQVASMMTVLPQTKDGGEVIGRDIDFSIAWNPGL